MHALVHAFRTLRRLPGFAGTALLTLAIGIGASTAMFAVVYGVLLKPLPYRDPAPCLDRRRDLLRRDVGTRQLLGV